MDNQTQTQFTHTTKADVSTVCFLPMFLSEVSAGFPSPATDYEESKLDLNTHLIANPNATFFVRVKGDSMVDANIESGDIAIVDRSLEARNGDVILAVIDGDFTIKRIEITNAKGDTLFSKNKLAIHTLGKKRIRLLPENSNFEAIEINENMVFQVWGVVTSTIHKTR